MVGIADVDALVNVHSAIDSHAAENCTSVYTGIQDFLDCCQRNLSTDLTSLVEGTDRPSMVIDMVLARDGNSERKRSVSARIHNYAKLSYESVGAWLDSEWRRT